MYIEKLRNLDDNQISRQSSGPLPRSHPGRGKDTRPLSTGFRDGGSLTFFPVPSPFTQIY